MTIEKLEALERAATAGPISVGMLDDGTLVLICDGDHVAELPCTGDEETQRATADVLSAARNAIGPLLAVAKAAKCYTNAAPMVRGEAYRDLCEAIAKLEATP